MAVIGDRHGELPSVRVQLVCCSGFDAKAVNSKAIHPPKKVWPPPIGVMAQPFDASEGK